MPTCSFDLTPPLPVQPRQWQSQLIQQLRTRLAMPSLAGHDVLVHAGPGAGKTLGALLSVLRLRQSRQLQHLVVFCHRNAIANQWLQAAARLGIELAAWSADAADPPGEHPRGLLISYQTATLHQERLRAMLQGWSPSAWMAVADEVHHLGVDPDNPEAAAWGHAFSTVTASAALRLGLSGTPFRADQLAFCAARRIRVRHGDSVSERIVPDLCVEPRQLIAAGDVRPLEFRFQDGWVEHDGSANGGVERSCLSSEERESWRARNLRRAIRISDGNSIALRVLLGARQQLERLRQEHPGAGGLVIARDIAHARRISQLLEEQGEQVRLVHSLDPEAAGNLQGFQQGHGDWLVSIDMCSEGFDAPRIRVVAYLSTVVTRSRFVQAITRAVRLDGSRCDAEPIPRHASTVFAPADPLLMSYARSWSVSEPYLVRPQDVIEPSGAAGSGGGPASPPRSAVADGAESLIALRGPALPGFLSSMQRSRSA